MSTSPSPALAPRIDPADSATEPQEISQFPYREVPSGARRLAAMASANTGLLGENADHSNEMASRIHEARTLGRQEGMEEAVKRFEQQLAQERSSIVSALAEFSKDRSAYFQKAEAEVVQLALSIARKVLHREAQLDPLLLAGIVRVALERIEGATEVVLVLHPQNAADWRRYLALHVEPGRMPEIIEDPAMDANSCQLRTSMGTAQIGLEAQLKEIEQGLMDLLAARPGANS